MGNSRKISHRNRLRPFGISMSDIKSKAQAAKQLAQAAVNKVQPLAQRVVAYAQPMAQQAVAYAQPMAQQAVAYAQPMAQQAVAYAQPMVQAGQQAVQQAVAYAQPMVQAGQQAVQQAVAYAQPMVQAGQQQAVAYAQPMVQALPNVQVEQKPISSGGFRASHKKSKLNEMRYLQSKAYVAQYENSVSQSSNDFHQVVRFLNKSRRPQRLNYF